MGGLEFRGYENDTIADENPTSTITIVKVDGKNNNRPWMTFNSNDLNKYNSDGNCYEGYIGGDYYDGNNEGGWDPKKWEIYTVSHKHFAGKEMAFENKTSETLTTSKPCFMN